MEEESECGDMCAGGARPAGRLVKNLLRRPRGHPPRGSLHIAIQHNTCAYYKHEVHASALRGPCEPCVPACRRETRVSSEIRPVYHVGVCQQRWTLCKLLLCQPRTARTRARGQWEAEAHPFGAA